MTIHRVVPAVLCLASMVLGAVPAAGQVTHNQTSPPAAPAAEVTPFVSLGSHFSSQIGAAISFAWTTNLDVEAEVGYRQKGLNALGASVNLVYNLPPLGRMIPYVAGGVGLEQYETAIGVPTFGVLTLKNTAISTNLGGGVKVRITERVWFRSDARWLSPLGKAPEGWRFYNGATFGVGKR